MREMEPWEAPAVTRPKALDFNLQVANRISLGIREPTWSGTHMEAS